MCSVLCENIDTTNLVAHFYYNLSGPFPWGPGAPMKEPRVPIQDYVVPFKDPGVPIQLPKSYKYYLSHFLSILLHCVPRFTCSLLLSASLERISKRKWLKAAPYSRVCFMSDFINDDIIL